METTFCLNMSPFFTCTLQPSEWHQPLWFSLQPTPAVLAFPSRVAVMPAATSRWSWDRLSGEHWLLWKPGWEAHSRNYELHYNLNTTNSICLWYADKWIAQLSLASYTDPPLSLHVFRLQLRRPVNFLINSSSSPTRISLAVTITLTIHLQLSNYLSSTKNCRAL
jgi:hypothetical protein